LPPSCYGSADPPGPPSFPTRRSSDLVGARLGLATGQGFGGLIRQQYGVPRAAFAIGIMLLANLGDTVAEFAGIGAALAIFGVPIDRKSTRLNSSHLVISYAVFCLKKK